MRRCRRRTRPDMRNGTDQAGIMACFRIAGAGEQAPGPVEKTALAAAAAEVERGSLQRLCGKHGRVEASGEDGRNHPRTVAPAHPERSPSRLRHRTGTLPTR